MATAKKKTAVKKKPTSKQLQEKLDNTELSLLAYKDLLKESRQEVERLRGDLWSEAKKAEDLANKLYKIPNFIRWFWRV